MLPVSPSSPRRADVTPVQHNQAAPPAHTGLSVAPSIGPVHSAASVALVPPRAAPVTRTAHAATAPVVPNVTTWGARAERMQEAAYFRRDDDGAYHPLLAGTCLTGQALKNVFSRDPSQADAEYKAIRPDTCMLRILAPTAAIVSLPRVTANGRFLNGATIVVSPDGRIAVSREGRITVPQAPGLAGVHQTMIEARRLAAFNHGLRANDAPFVETVRRKPAVQNAAIGFQRAGVVPGAQEDDPFAAHYIACGILAVDETIAPHLTQAQRTCVQEALLAAQRLTLFNRETQIFADKPHAALEAHDSTQLSVIEINDAVMDVMAQAPSVQILYAHEDDSQWAAWRDSFVQDRFDKRCPFRVATLFALRCVRQQWRAWHPEASEAFAGAGTVLAAAQPVPASALQMPPTQNIDAAKVRFSSSASLRQALRQTLVALLVENNASAGNAGVSRWVRLAVHPGVAHHLVKTLNLPAPDGPQEQCAREGAIRWLCRCYPQFFMSFLQATQPQHVPCNDAFTAQTIDSLVAAFANTSV